MHCLAEVPVLSRLTRVLASAPSPQEILSITMSDGEMDKLRQLMLKQDYTRLSAEEANEVWLLLAAENILETAKIEAHRRIAD